MQISLDSVSLATKGTPRLVDVSFEVPGGSFISVLGASGAGKSTLLGVVSGLIPQDSGRVLFDGRPVDDVPAYRRDVAVVFQDARLFPNMNALDNVAFPLKVRGVGRRERRERAAAMLAQVQLEGMGRRGVHELSGGQRQRVALARALVAGPRAVLLDEPFSGLDESLRDDMRRLVLDLHDRLGTTMLMVTHDPMEALVMSDRVAYLSHGRLVQYGTPTDVLLHPVTPEVAESFGAAHALEGRVVQGVFTCGKLQIPLAAVAQANGRGSGGCGGGCGCGGVLPPVPDGPAVLLRTASGFVDVHALPGPVAEKSSQLRDDAPGQPWGERLAREPESDQPPEPFPEQSASSSNAVDLAALQAYVDANDDLHDALGVPRGIHLPLSPFAQGEYNANYALDLVGMEGPGDPGDPEGPEGLGGPGAGQAQRRLLVRVNLGSQMHLPDQIGYEMAALRILEPSGRTPHALYVDGSRSRFPLGVGVEKRLPGRPLRYETDLAEAAAVLADIHALPEPIGTPFVTPAHPLASVVEECAQMYAAYEAWPRADPQVKAAVDRLFEVARAIATRDLDRPAPERRHIVNTELNSSNFLINDGPEARSYLIDWEKPVLGEVEQDLGHFLAPTTTFWKTDTVLTRADVERFVGLYEDAVAGRFSTKGLRERLDEYLAVTCLRGVTWCAMALTEYEGGGRPVTNADTYQKIKAYLAPEFLAFLEREWVKPRGA